MILMAPGMIQPGPAAMTAVHQRNAVGLRALGHEAQDVHLLADLSDECENDAACRAGTEQIEAIRRAGLRRHTRSKLAKLASS